MVPLLKLAFLDCISCLTNTWSNTPPSTSIFGLNWAAVFVRCHVTSWAGSICIRAWRQKIKTCNLELCVFINTHLILPLLQYAPSCFPVFFEPQIKTVLSRTMICSKSGGCWFSCTLITIIQFFYICASALLRFLSERVCGWNILFKGTLLQIFSANLRNQWRKTKKSQPAFLTSP